jgi:hypothetical protein
MIFLVVEGRRRRVMLGASSLGLLAVGILLLTLA